MTDRTLTAAVIAETEAAGGYANVAFLDLEFATDPLYVWTGLGTYTATMPNGVSHDYLGVGDLGSIDGISETADIYQNGVALTMSGIDNDLLSAALTQDYQGRTIRIFSVFLDADLQIIASPVLVFAGQMDILSTIDGDTSGSITIQCESRVARLRGTSESLLTDEEQQRLFPGDLGLQFVMELQSKQINWGVPGGTGAVGGGGGGTGIGTIQK